MVRLFFFHAGVLGYLEVEVAILSRDGGDRFKFHKLQRVELFAIYYLVRDESREVMDKLSYYVREFCK